MKRLIILILALIISLCFSSCKEEIELNENIVSFSKFPKEEKVFFNKMFEFNKGTPDGILLMDSTMIIINNGRSIDYFCYNYSFDNKKLSKGYLRKGRGPNEILSVASFGMQGNTFRLHDVTLKKILTINKEKLLEDNFIFNEYKVSENYNNVTFIDSLHFLTKSNKKSSFKINEIELLSFKQINKFGKFSSIPDDIPIDVVKDAYTSYMYLKPSGDKIVLPYRYADIIEIYDLKQNRELAAQGPMGFDPEFKIGNAPGYHYMDKTNNTRKAFVNGAVTNNYIYLVYSGHLRPEQNWSYGKFVYVYDWNGNPIKKITLDRYVYTIGVSADDKIIYSYDMRTGDIIEAPL